jgi:hypothetical protein
MSSLICIVSTITFAHTSLFFDKNASLESPARVLQFPSLHNNTVAPLAVSLQAVIIEGGAAILLMSLLFHSRFGFGLQVDRNY